MYIDLNDEQISTAFAAMTAHIQALEEQNEWLRDRLAAETRRANTIQPTEPEVPEEFDADALEEYLREVEGCE